MAKKKDKTVFYCTDCGGEFPKWMGKCPGCGSWDTLVEEKKHTTYTNQNSSFSKERSKPVQISEIKVCEKNRLKTDIVEFDRVLGGGLVDGSLVLIGGDPGIGKSTLMLQALHKLSSKNIKVLYVSGEESPVQIKLRSERLPEESTDLLVVSEINLEAILNLAETEKPGVLVVDSIQTVFSGEIGSAPGSVSQVREATMRLMVMAKKTGIPTLIVGHVTKDGAIAGPKIMEHMVDTVLYFEGDRNHIFRILRAVKNRFGSTNEIGVFEMRGTGLFEISNPSEIFLSERPVNVPGSIVTACMEGTRPILVEIQGLASSSSLGTPRRTVIGVDHNRVSLLVAVLEKKVGMNLAGLDIFMNVAGGVKINEPAADLGIITAIASSFLNKSIPEGMVIIGEVGLTGEVRAVSHIEKRVQEIEKMGFSKCVIPKVSLKNLTGKYKLEILTIDTLAEALEIIF
ncbi:MAG: DNA repair protein RadA [Desulfobacterales bacterium]|nr:DNA repair protein RadA [Desulfobacterales bacterium]MCP4158457.1 DNA repair protein RadA [Deltaproteobacteria bacterium]